LDLKGLKKDGSEFPVEVSLSPFKSSEGLFVVAFVVDNTYRKSYENSILQQKQELATLSEALQELNEGLESKVAKRTAELEQAKNDLAAALNKERELGELKSRFVSMASHEFRTPLTSVLSSAGLAAQYAERQDFENVKKHTERIKNAVNGLNTILTEFLSLGRLEEGRLAVNWEEADLAQCIAEVHEGLKNLFKSGQTFEHQHSDKILARRCAYCSGNDCGGKNDPPQRPRPRHGHPGGRTKAPVRPLFSRQQCSQFHTRYWAGPVHRTTICRDDGRYSWL
jgi:signal transduction histidine kinase